MVPLSTPNLGLKKITSNIHLQYTPKIGLKTITRHGSKIKSCLNGTDMLFYPLTSHFPGKKVRASVGQSCASGSEPKQRPCQGGLLLSPRYRLQQKWLNIRCMYKIV